MVDRPLADKRPYGPFINVDSEDVSYFERVEVQTNSADENTTYSVLGILESNVIGLSVDTNALTLNGDASFSVFERETRGAGLDMEDYIGDAGVEFVSSGGSIVGIGQADKNLTNIVVVPESVKKGPFNVPRTMAIREDMREGDNSFSTMF